MSVTVEVVKKLILEYIGGQKVFGNTKQVFIQDKRVVIQRGNLIDQLKGFMNNPFGSIGGMLGNLVSNPISPLIDEMRNNLTGLLDNTFMGLIPDAQYLQLSSLGSDFNSVLDDLQYHTDILSGLNVDFETIPDNKVPFSTLMGMDDPNQIKSLAGALFQDNTFKQISDSLNISVPGGVSGMVNPINTSEFGSDQMSAFVDSLCKQLNDHMTTIDNIIGADENAYEEYRLNRDMDDIVSGMIPVTDNEVFNRVASGQFADFTKTLG